MINITGRLFLSRMSNLSVQKSNRFWLLFGITAGALVIGRVFGMYIRHPYDDAFITFRYAQNLAAGHGLVYNIGERILGTTSPLFALILSLPALLGLDLPLVAQILNILFDCLTLFLVFYWAKRNSMVLAAVLFALFLPVNR